jgi:hypothetical protein
MFEVMRAMRSRRPTRAAIDRGWWAASRTVLLALVLAAAPAPVPAADDLVPNLIPRASASSEDLEAGLRPDDGRLRLRLVWCDILHRAPFPFEVMSAEVERILGGENVDVTWRVFDGEGVIFGDSEIKVILLDQPRGRPSRERQVMGATPREGTSRTAWAYSSTVLWALGLAREEFLSPPQQQEFARALGRVVAHEVVHVIAPEIPHARGGLMQPGMDRAALLRPGLGLESAQRRTFETGLASLSGVPAPLDRAAAAPRRRLP